MSRRAAGRKGAKAAWLHDASKDERFFVLTVRRWLDGPAGQEELWNSMAREIGGTSARRFFQTFEDYLGAVADGASRRLSRHAACCPCLGDDEALLAGVVGEAGRGKLDSALSLAAEFVHDHALETVVGAAAELGALIRQMGDLATRTHPAGVTIH
ncbi:hypothetical protein KHP62_13700 [Rhodobacteraceae bacterium NNCM2]|nr:hypothetical protein [Coraliihabitans acroporae]